MNKYTTEQIEFLRKNKVNTGKDLIRMFYEEFGIMLTENALNHLKYNYSLQSRLKGGQFKKNQIPFNKGKKWAEYMPVQSQEKSKKTCYKKGNIPHNHKVVGSERLDKYGYTLIKIAEPKKWVSKQRIVYEQEKGKIPKGYIVCFADGNKQNFNIDNLILIKREENAIMNKFGLYGNNSDITKVGLMTAKLIKKTNNKLKEIQK